MSVFIVSVFTVSICQCLPMCVFVYHYQCLFVSAGVAEVGTHHAGTTCRQGNTSVMNALNISTEGKYLFQKVFAHKSKPSVSTYTFDMLIFFTMFSVFLTATVQCISHHAHDCSRLVKIRIIFNNL